MKSKELQVNLSGITYLIKLPLTGSVTNLPCSGRPKKQFMKARAFIEQQMRRNDETTSAKIWKKLAKCGILVSSSLVWRSQKQQGWILKVDFRIFFRTFQTSCINDRIQICSCVNIIIRKLKKHLDTVSAKNVYCSYMLKAMEFKFVHVWT